MRVKICGITKPDQGHAIAHLGATALGFICVRTSPRYVLPEQIQAVVEQLPLDVDRIGVFADSTLEEICHTVADAGLNGIQLHGNESLELCQQLRQSLPNIEIIKALRVKTPEDLDRADAYASSVDTLLLDAYHPNLLGGTGKTLDWSSLRLFRPRCPWLLAGGLTPDNVLEALSQVQPRACLQTTLSDSDPPKSPLKRGCWCPEFTSGQGSNPRGTLTEFSPLKKGGGGGSPGLQTRPSGIDLSSGVERSPGDKDLDRVAQLFERLERWFSGRFLGTLGAVSR